MFFFLYERMHEGIAILKELVSMESRSHCKFCYVDGNSSACKSQKLTTIKM